MTRKHFQLIADAIKTTDMPADVRLRVATQMATKLSTTNPRFDCYRFVKACGCE